MNWILSYCPFQKQFHIEEEPKFWTTTEGVFRRARFEGCAYVPIRRCKSSREAMKWIKIYLERDNKLS